MKSVTYGLFSLVKNASFVTYELRMQHLYLHFLIRTSYVNLISLCLWLSILVVRIPSRHSCLALFDVLHISGIAVYIFPLVAVYYISKNNPAYSNIQSRLFYLNFVRFIFSLILSGVIFLFSVVRVYIKWNIKIFH